MNEKDIEVIDCSPQTHECASNKVLNCFETMTIMLALEQFDIESTFPPSLSISIEKMLVFCLRWTIFVSRSLILSQSKIIILSVESGLLSSRFQVDLLFYRITFCHIKSAFSFFEIKLCVDNKKCYSIKFLLKLENH